MEIKIKQINFEVHEILILLIPNNKKDLWKYYTVTLDAANDRIIRIARLGEEKVKGDQYDQIMKHEKTLAKLLSDCSELVGNAEGGNE